MMQMTAWMRATDHNERAVPWTRDLWMPGASRTTQSFKITQRRGAGQAVLCARKVPKCAQPKSLVRYNENWIFLGEFMDPDVIGLCTPAPISTAELPLRRFQGVRETPACTMEGLGQRSIFDIIKHKLSRRAVGPPPANRRETRR
jgi:hypothetical protein